MSTDYLDTVLDEDKAVNEVVSDFIRTALTAFETKVDDIFLSTLDVPFATELAMLKIDKIIELALMEHDGNSTFEDEQLEVFIPDGEPMPSTIDSWARGTVAVKKVAPDEQKIPHSFSNETPSVSSSYTGRSSNTGRGSSRGSSRGTARTTGGAGKAHDADNTGKIIELEEDGEGDFAGLGSTGYMFDMLQKSKRKKEHGVFEKDTEKGEFTLLQEQMEQAKKELRGKKFVLDRYGKPVVVGSVNAEKLAPFSTPVIPNIKGTGQDMDLDNMSTGSQDVGRRKGSQTSMGSQDNKPKKKQFVRVAGSRGVEESSFKPTLSLAVTLSGIEHIPKLQPGVVVRSSTSVRSGEKVPDDPKHMSRKQYLSQSLSRRSALGENSSLDSMSRTLDANSSMITSDPTRVGERGSVFSGTSRASRSHAGGSTHSGGHGRSVVTTMRSMEGLQDVDRFEGARPVPTAGPSIHDASDEELGLGPVNTKGNTLSPTRPKKVTAKQKANIELLSGNPENGRPKDRDLPKNMRPVAERKHLPAPPLGHITGHGLSVEKYNEKSKLVAAEEEDWHQDWRV
eukprot:CAMPEP_0184976798 /NCGR_PEP_ID=MMETSP1098-20130426/7695_1 /TAXON_ID=89044 /ORGANISM="Spumella elongata, Strain CCAP 955/1" /LENGTH=565 /DNA_ID=CAMNT_0027499735 /DNA_START=41 /DNA_END=1738 /DNA_ORIENTATION=+